MIIIKKFSTIFIAMLLLLTGCSKIDKNTEEFITEYLILRFEAINMMGGMETTSDKMMEHTELIKPYLSEKRYIEFARNGECRAPFVTYDFSIRSDAIFKIENMKIEKKEKNVYTYEVVVTINNAVIDTVKQNLKTKYTGTLKIDEEGLIYYDWIDKMKGDTEILDN